MIVKFFGNKGGGSASASIDYLLDQKKHDEQTEILQGDPELSREIAEGLEFANTYTVGCLSFEEKPGEITDQDKREIMDRFEQSIFSGLEKEQYNITWIQHTDKDRLELNFFIPNVELTTGKRLQPYYDKADRPIAENFKQVINHEYGLTDPNDPKKQQALIEKRNLPKAKQEALEAINNGIEGLAKAGQINSRNDVIQALEGAGFEVARVTPKNISIKTDGQNLRLKGAFYEQDFRGGESLRETIESRAREYERNSTERYQTARERLNSVVSKRQREFSKRYPNRANQISEEISKSIQTNINGDIAITRSGGGRSKHMGDDGIQRDDRVETVGSELREDKQIIENKPLRSGEQSKPVLHRDRPETQREVLGRQQQFSGITDNNRGLNDRDRTTARERIARLVEQVRKKYDSISGRIKEFTGRERINHKDVHRNDEAKRTNQQSISDIKQATQTLAKENKKQQSRGFSR